MRHPVFAFLSLTLAACGGGTNAPPDTLAASAAPPAVSSVITVAALEKSGKLPVLDRGPGLQGVDANRNGVRDDLDAWIAAQGFTPAQVKAAVQVALSLQRTIDIDLADDAQLRAASQLAVRAVVCAGARFSDRESSRVLNTLQKYTMNTQPRVMKYLQYNQAQNGSVTQLPSGDTCA